MGSPPKDHQELLESHLLDGERSIDARWTGLKTHLLTDRRVLTVETSGQDEEITTLQSIFLDQLGGVRIKQKSPPDYDSETLGYGIFSLGIAFVALLLGEVIDGEIASLLIAVGLGVGILGVVLLFEAFDTDDDSVVVSLRSPGGNVVKTLVFGENHQDFAESVSRAVSNAHGPGSKTKKKVG